MEFRLATLGFLLAAACSQPQPGKVPRATSTGTFGGTPTGTAGGTTTPGTDTDTGTTATTTTTLDCSILPPMPANYTTLTGYSTAEDFDFDGDGYAVAEEQGNLRGRDQYGNTKTITTGMGWGPAGTRVLPTGDIVYAKGDGTLRLVDVATGGTSLLAGGMVYPNGVEVDELNNVYTADQSTGRVHRINAYNPSDYELVAEGLSYPNGVILSPDGNILYVGSFGGGVIYAIDRDPKTGAWGAPRILAQSPGGDMGFDGINVDACGNVYWTEYIVGKIRRITPDGQTVDLVADVPSGWIPNMRWGHDIGGWNSDILYVSDRDQGRIFALEVGIQGKKHVLMP